MVDEMVRSFVGPGIDMPFSALLSVTRRGCLLAKVLLPNGRCSVTLSIFGSDRARLGESQLGYSHVLPTNEAHTRFPREFSSALVRVRFGKIGTDRSCETLTSFFRKRSLIALL